MKKNYCRNKYLINKHPIHLGRLQFIFFNTNKKSIKLIMRVLSNIYNLIDPKYMIPSISVGRKNYGSLLRIIRSPHVNSKSKESFRFKYFTSTWTLCFRYSVVKQILALLGHWKVIKRVTFNTKMNSIKVFRKYNKYDNNSKILPVKKRRSLKNNIDLSKKIKKNSDISPNLHFKFLINFVKPWYYYMYRNFSFLEDILRFFGFKVDPRYNIKWDYSDTDYYMEEYYESAKNLEYSEVYNQYWRYIKLYQKELEFDKGHLITNNKYNQLHGHKIKPDWSIWLDETIDKFIKDAKGSLMNNIELGIDILDLDLYKGKRHEDYFYTKITKFWHGLLDQSPFSRVMDDKFNLVKDISKLNPYSSINNQPDLVEENIRVYQAYDYWFVTDLTCRENGILVFDRNTDNWVDIITPQDYLNFLESSHILSIESEQSLASVINFYESYYYDNSYNRVTNWISSYIDIYPELTDVQKNHYFLRPWPSEPNNDLIFTPDLLAWESTYWKDFMWSYYQSKWYFYVNDSIISTISSKVYNWFELVEFFKMLYFDNPNLFIFICFTVFWVCFILSLPYLYLMKGPYFVNFAGWLFKHGNKIVNNKFIIKVISIFKSNTYKLGIVFYKLEKIIFKDFGTYLYGFNRARRLPRRPLFVRQNLFKPTEYKDVYEKYRIRTLIKLTIFGKLTPAENYPDFLRWDTKFKTARYMYPKTWREKVFDPIIGSNLVTIIYFLFIYLLLSPKYGSTNHELANYRDKFRFKNSDYYDQRKTLFRRSKRYKFKRREYLWKEKMDEFRLKKYFNTIENSIGEYNIDYFKPKYREEIQYILDNKNDPKLVKDYKKHLSSTAKKKNYDKTVFREQKWWKQGWEANLPENNEKHHPMKYRKLGYIAKYEYRNYRRTFYNYYDWLIDKKDYLKLYHTDKKIELEYSYIKKKVDNLDDIADFIISSGENIEKLILKDVNKEAIEVNHVYDDQNFQQEIAIMAYRKHIDILTYYLEYLDELPDENLYSDLNLFHFLNEKLGGLDEADHEILKCYLPHFKSYAVKSQKYKTNLDLFFEDILLNYISVIKFYLVTSFDKLLELFPHLSKYFKSIKKAYIYLKEVVLDFNDWYNYNFSSPYRILKTLLYWFIDFFNYLVKLFYLLESYIFYFIYNLVDSLVYKTPAFLGKSLEKPEWEKWVANTWYHNLYIGIPYDKLLKVFPEKLVLSIEGINLNIYKYWISYFDICANFIPQVWNYTYLLFFNFCLRSYQKCLKSFFIVKYEYDEVYHWKFFDYGNIFKLEKYLTKKIFRLYGMYVEDGTTFFSREYFNLWLNPVYNFELYCIKLKNQILYPGKFISATDSFSIVNQEAFITDIKNFKVFSFFYRLRFLFGLISDILLNFITYWFIELKRFCSGLYRAMFDQIYSAIFKSYKFFAKYQSMKYDIESASHYNVSLNHYKNNCKGNDEFFNNFKESLINNNKFFIKYNERNEICINFEDIEKEIPGLFLYLSGEPELIARLSESKSEIIMDVESFGKLKLNWFDMNLLQQWHYTHYSNSYMDDYPSSFDFNLKSKKNVFKDRNIYDLKMNFDSFLSNYIYLMFRFKEIFLTIKEDITRLLYKGRYWFLRKYSYFFNEKYKFKALLRNEQIIIDNYRGHTKSRYVPTTGEKLYYKKRTEKEGSFGTFSNYWINLQIEYNILKMYYKFAKKYFKKFIKEHYLESEGSKIKVSYEKFLLITTPIRFIREHGYYDSILFCITYPNKKEFLFNSWNSIINFFINLPEKFRVLGKYYAQVQNLYSYIMSCISKLIEVLALKISGYIYEIFNFIFEFYYYFFFLVFFHTSRLVMVFFTYLYYLTYYIYKPIYLIIEDLYTCFLFFSSFTIIHLTVHFKENLNLFTWRCINTVRWVFLFVYDFPIHVHTIFKEWMYLINLYYKNFWGPSYYGFIELYSKYIILKIIYISDLEVKQNLMLSYYNFLEFCKKPSTFLESWVIYRLFTMKKRNESSSADVVYYTYVNKYVIFNDMWLEEGTIEFKNGLKNVNRELACYWHLDTLEKVKRNFLNMLVDAKDLNFYRMFYILNQYLTFSYYIFIIKVKVHLNIIRFIYNNNISEGYLVFIKKLYSSYKINFQNYNLSMYYKMKEIYFNIWNGFPMWYEYFALNSFLTTIFYPVTLFKEFVTVSFYWLYHSIYYLTGSFIYAELSTLKKLVVIAKDKFFYLFINVHFYPILETFDILKQYFISRKGYVTNTISVFNYIKEYILERFSFFYKNSYIYDLSKQSSNRRELLSFDRYVLERIVPNDKVVNGKVLFIDYLKSRELSSKEVMYLMQQIEYQNNPATKFNDYVDIKLNRLSTKFKQTFWFLPNQKFKREENNILGNIDKKEVSKYFSDTWYKPAWAFAKRHTLISPQYRLFLNTKRATDYWLFHEEHIKSYTTLQEIYIKDYLNTYPLTTDEEVLKNLGINNNLERNLYLISCWYEHRYIHDIFQLNAFKYQYKYKRYWNSLIESPKTYQSFFNDNSLKLRYLENFYFYISDVQEWVQKDVDWKQYKSVDGVDLKDDVHWDIRLPRFKDYLLEFKYFQISFSIIKSFLLKLNNYFEYYWSSITVTLFSNNINQYILGYFTTIFSNIFTYFLKLLKIVVQFIYNLIYLQNALLEDFIFFYNYFNKYFEFKFGTDIKSFLFNPIAWFDHFIYWLYDIPRHKWKNEYKLNIFYNNWKFSKDTEKLLKYYLLERHDGLFHTVSQNWWAFYRDVWTLRSKPGKFYTLSFWIFDSFNTFQKNITSYIDHELGLFNWDLNSHEDFNSYILLRWFYGLKFSLKELFYIFGKFVEIILCSLFDLYINTIGYLTLLFKNILHFFKDIIPVCIYDVQVYLYFVFMDISYFLWNIFFYNFFCIFDLILKDAFKKITGFFKAIDISSFELSSLHFNIYLYLKDSVLVKLKLKNEGLLWDLYICIDNIMWSFKDLINSKGFFNIVPDFIYFISNIFLLVFRSFYAVTGSQPFFIFTIVLDDVINLILLKTPVLNIYYNILDYCSEINKVIYSVFNDKLYLLLLLDHIALSLVDFTIELISVLRFGIYYILDHIFFLSFWSVNGITELWEDVKVGLLLVIDDLYRVGLKLIYIIKSPIDSLFKLHMKYIDYRFNIKKDVDFWWFTDIVKIFIADKIFIVIKWFYLNFDKINVKRFYVKGDLNRNLPKIIGDDWNKLNDFEKRWYSAVYMNNSKEDISNLSTSFDYLIENPLKNSNKAGVVKSLDSYPEYKIVKLIENYRITLEMLGIPLELEKKLVFRYLFFLNAQIDSARSSNESKTELFSYLSPKVLPSLNSNLNWPFFFYKKRIKEYVYNFLSIKLKKDFTQVFNSTTSNKAYDKEVVKIILNSYSSFYYGHDFDDLVNFYWKAQYFRNYDILKEYLMLHIDQMKEPIQAEETPNGLKNFKGVVQDLNNEKGWLGQEYLSDREHLLSDGKFTKKFENLTYKEIVNLVGKIEFHASRNNWKTLPNGKLLPRHPYSAGGFSKVHKSFKPNVMFYRYHPGIAPENYRSDILFKDPWIWETEAFGDIGDTLGNFNMLNNHKSNKEGPSVDNAINRDQFDVFVRELIREDNLKKQFKKEFLNSEYLYHRGRMYNWFFRQKNLIEKYKFFEWNQKTYNYYVDNFGKVFGFIYYHFPGQSLYYKDKLYNTYESVSLVFNFLSKKPSVFSPTNIVNRVNNYDFKTFFISAENYSRFNKYHKDYSIDSLGLGGWNHGIHGYPLTYIEGSKIPNLEFFVNKYLDFNKYLLMVGTRFRKESSNMKHRSLLDHRIMSKDMARQHAMANKNKLLEWQNMQKQQLNNIYGNRRSKFYKYYLHSVRKMTEYPIFDKPSYPMQVKKKRNKDRENLSKYLYRAYWQRPSMGPRKRNRIWNKSFIFDDQFKINLPKTKLTEKLYRSLHDNINLRLNLAVKDLYFKKYQKYHTRHFPLYNSKKYKEFLKKEYPSYDTTKGYIDFVNESEKLIKDNSRTIKDLLFDANKYRKSEIEKVLELQNNLKKNINRHNLYWLKQVKKDIENLETFKFFGSTFNNVKHQYIRKPYYSYAIKKDNITDEMSELYAKTQNLKLTTGRYIRTGLVKVLPPQIQMIPKRFRNLVGISGRNKLGKYSYLNTRRYQRRGYFGQNVYRKNRRGVKKIIDKVELEKAMSNSGFELKDHQKIFLGSYWKNLDKEYLKNRLTDLDYQKLSLGDCDREFRNKVEFLKKYGTNNVKPEWFDYLEKMQENKRKSKAFNYMIKDIMPKLFQFEGTNRENLKYDREGYFDLLHQTPDFFTKGGYKIDGKAPKFPYEDTHESRDFHNVASAVAHIIQKEYKSKNTEYFKAALKNKIKKKKGKVRTNSKNSFCRNDDNIETSDMVFKGEFKEKKGDTMQLRGDIQTIRKQYYDFFVKSLNSYDKEFSLGSILWQRYTDEISYGSRMAHQNNLSYQNFLIKSKKGLERLSDAELSTEEGILKHLGLKNEHNVYKFDTLDDDVLTHFAALDLKAKKKYRRSKNFYDLYDRVRSYPIKPVKKYRKVYNQLGEESLFFNIDYDPAKQGKWSLFENITYLPAFGWKGTNYLVKQNNSISWNYANHLFEKPSEYFYKFAKYQRGITKKRGQRRYYKPKFRKFKRFRSIFRDDEGEPTLTWGAPTYRITNSMNFKESAFLNDWISLYTQDVLSSSANIYFRNLKNKTRYSLTKSFKRDSYHNSKLDKHKIFNIKDIDWTKVQRNVLTNNFKYNKNFINNDSLTHLELDEDNYIDYFWDIDPSAMINQQIVYNKDTGDYSYKRFLNPKLVNEYKDTDQCEEHSFYDFEYEDWETPDLEQRWANFAVEYKWNADELMMFRMANNFDINSEHYTLDAWLFPYLGLMREDSFEVFNSYLFNIPLEGHDKWPGLDDIAGDFCNDWRDGVYSLSNNVNHIYNETLFNKIKYNEGTGYLTYEAESDLTPEVITTGSSQSDMNLDRYGTPYAVKPLFAPESFFASKFMQKHKRMGALVEGSTKSMNKVDPRILFANMYNPNKFGYANELMNNYQRDSHRNSNYYFILKATEPYRRSYTLWTDNNENCLTPPRIAIKASTNFSELTNGDWSNDSLRHLVNDSGNAFINGLPKDALKRYNNYSNYLTDGVYEYVTYAENGLGLKTNKNYYNGIHTDCYTETWENSDDDSSHMFFKDLRKSLRYLSKRRFINDTGSFPVEYDTRMEKNITKNSQKVMFHKEQERDDIDMESYLLENKDNRIYNTIFKDLLNPDYWRPISSETYQRLKWGPLRFFSGCSIENLFNGKTKVNNKDYNDGSEQSHNSVQYNYSLEGLISLKEQILENNINNIYDIVPKRITELKDDALNNISNFIYPSIRYDVASVNSVYLDIFYNNLIYRERVYSKPSCYHYWVFYDNEENVFNSFNSSKNLNFDIWNWCVAFDWQFGFQDPATPIMEGIIDLHHDLLFILIVVCVFVLWLIILIVFSFTPRVTYLHYIFNLVLSELILELFEVLQSFCNLLLKLLSWFNKKNLFNSNQNFILKGILNFYLYLNNKKYYFLYRTTQIDSNISEMDAFFGGKSETVTGSVSKSNIKKINVWFPQTFTHHSVIEIVWTIVPVLILISIAIPSFSLLYATDQIWNPVFTIKVLGNQWYWSYEYC